MEHSELRQTAACWSLAGDHQLLSILQNLHQRIMTRCQETNAKLDQMVTALDHASIHLQNVNNKFMALSNSQFVESRVYDDDEVISSTDIAQNKELPQPSPEPEVDRVRRSLKVLEELHECVTIMSDSDSDTGSEDEDHMDRAVLRPRDMYAERPLPYIIGTPSWNNKWHAGLRPEESDSDRSAADELGPHSDSETESLPGSTDRLTVPDRTISSASSDMVSEVVTASTPIAPRPADVAAELARRLGGNVQTPGPEVHPPAPVARVVHKAQPLHSGPIFPEEPPPLPASPPSSPESDIFAELHRGQAEPFGTQKDHADIFNDFAPGNPVLPSPAPRGSQKSTLFEDELEPELFTTQPVEESNDNDKVKKPVGGISLFGAKNSESIGAAILKRKQRPSSSSGDEIDNKEPLQIKQSQTSKTVEKRPDISKNIFDDLFAKSEKIQKKEIAKEVKEKKTIEPEKKVDIFSDNLFDDIDDIFSTNIVKPKPQVTRNDKPLFDDNDDLFADIAVRNTKIETKSIADTISNTKSIFDSDDDLFSETVVKTVSKEAEKVSKKPVNEQTKITASKVCENETKSIFDSDDDNVFANITKTVGKSQKNIRANVLNLNNNKSTRNEPNSEQNNEQMNKKDKQEDSIFTDNTLFTNVKSKLLKETPKPTPVIKPVTSMNLFDDDDDELFKEPTNKPSVNKTDTHSHKESDENKTNTPDDSIVASKRTASLDTDVVRNIKDLDLNTTVNEKEEVLSKDADDDWNTSDDIDEIQETGLISEYNPENNENQNNNNKTEKPNIFMDNSRVSEILKTQNNTNAHEEITTDEQISNTNNKNTLNENANIYSNEFEDLVEKKSKVFDKTIDNVSRTKKPSLAQKASVTVKLNTDIDKALVNKDNTDTEKYKVQVDDKEGKTIRAPKAENDNKAKIIEHKTYQDEVSKLDNTNVLDSNRNVTKRASERPHNTFLHESPEIEVRKTSESDFDDIFNEAPPVFQTKQKSEQSDLFTDIFNDQPPDFKKPKEPKKSKNVNALFDDDSDDEALFLKKNDVILHDHPDEFISHEGGDGFDLFHDEPPTVNVDFLHKSDESNILVDNKNEFKPNVDQEVMFDSYIKGIATDEIQSNISTNNSEVFKKLIKPDIPDDVENISENVDDTVVAKTDKLESDIPDGTTGEPKKIGKLKPMNFNINVNTLLPGASPKKVQNLKEQTDGQTTSTKSNEELRSIEVLDKKLESNLVKSVSFENEPDSALLNNKLSKERAKIQVKRRPSTRRARHEAVKKSVDYGEDSTDNSISINDYVKDAKEEPKIEDNSPVGEVNKDLKKGHYTSDMGQDSKQKVTPITAILITKNETDPLNFNKDSITKSNEIFESIKPSPTRDVKSKVVYILNDEDIFNTSEITKSQVQREVVPKAHDLKTPLNITDDDDNEDIFKSMISQADSKNPTREASIEKSTNSIKGVQTLGKVYDFQTDPIETESDDIFKVFAKSVKPPSQSEPKLGTSTDTVKKDKQKEKSIFDDLSDEENDLFLKKKRDKMDSTKSLFGSDSEEDLFTGKRKSKKDTEVTESKMEKSKTVVGKSSLFGEDDDDDLFGVKSKKDVDSKPISTVPSKEPAVSTQSVFEDPLSLFMNDD